MLANLPAYFTSWAEELGSRADRVRNLIGSRHWLSDGVHKEFLIREFLSRHLPSDLNVSRGFIRKLEIDHVSPEIDLVIADPKRHAPIFREGGLQIVSPSSVLGTIEVKSTYRKAVLKDALTNVAKVREVAVRPGRGSEIWSSIMIGTAESDLTLRNVVDDTYDILASEKFWQEALSESPSRSRLDCIPSVISILDFCLILIEPISGTTESIRIRGFEARKASAALGFAQLFAFLRATLTNSVAPSELDSLLEQIEGLPIFIKDMEFTKP